MASEPPPGNPRPDQPPPAGSHARPASLPPVAGWLGDTPTGSVHDDLLFDELIAESEPLDGSPADGLVDLNQLDNDASHASGATYISDVISEPGGEEPETIFPPPPTGSTPSLTIAASDWLPPPPDLGAPTSDVILGHQRDTSEDALGGDGVRNASSSSIFEAPPEGSSRFDNPADPTEPVPDFTLPPPSDLLVEIEDTGSSGHLFNDRPVSPLDGLDDVVGSDVRLQDSSEASGIISTDSSIFGNLPSPESGVAAADLLAGVDEEQGEDIHVSDVMEPSSHIFMREADPDTEDNKVSFALPKSNTDDAPSGSPSGLIDWSTPGSGPRLTDHLTAEEAAAAGVPNLAALASAADTPMPAVTPAPRRSQAAQPTGRAPTPVIPQKSGLVGWLGGTAVGLLAGVGLSAGAYFGGLVPNSEAKPAVAGATAQLDTLRQQLADATQQADEVKTLAATAKADGDKAVSELVTARRALTTARSETQTATTARDKATQDLASAQKSLVDTQKLLTTAQGETKVAVEKAREDSKKALTDQMTLLTAAMKELDEKTKLLVSAETKVTDALTKQKAADETLATVVKELKAAKLIDEKDDATMALAKLPDVLKKAGATAASSDVQKAAAALLAAKKETEAARAEVRTAEAMVAKVKGEAQTAVDMANKKVATMMETFQQKEIDWHDQRAAAEKQFTTKLAAKDEEHRSQLAAARAGVIVPLSSGEIVAKERAADAFNAGVEAYFAGRYGIAEAALVKATQQDGTDARSWYFLGLTRFQLGQPTATEAFKKGGELEARSQPSAKTVTAALERVQGAARQALNAHRP